jgi:hypothetical protein
MEETLNKEKEQVLQKPKEPKPEDFGIAEKRIETLTKGPAMPISFKISLIISLILLVFLYINFFKKIDKDSNLLSTLVGVGCWYIIILFPVGFILDYVVNRYFPSLEKKYYQSWLTKQPDYKAFIEYKKKKEEYEREWRSLLEQKQKIRESRQRKVSSNLIEYKFPTGLKIYYPTNLEIVEDDLDKENYQHEKEKLSSEILFFATSKPEIPSSLALEDFFDKDFMMKYPPDYMIFVKRNRTEEHSYFAYCAWMKYKMDIQNATKIYIKSAINNFLKNLNSYKDNALEWNKLIETRKFGDNAVIWTEKLKLKNSNKLFIRTSKYLLHADENDFYAITINTLVSSKVYGENIDLIKTIIEKSGFEE